MSHWSNLALRLVLTYEQLEDRRINNIVNVCFCSFRFHVAVRLFSRRSQKTSKCAKNISDTPVAITSCASFVVLTTFWCHQWSTDYWKHGIYGENCDEHRRKSIWSWCTLSRVLWLSVNYAQSSAWYRSCDTCMVLFLTIRPIQRTITAYMDILRNAKLYDNGRFVEHV